jgi:hypothetical protein
MPFSKAIFMKLTVTRQHYVAIMSTEFDPSRSKNVDIMGRNLCMPLRKVWL